ncbi:MAG TPA: hypothetical protein VG406_25935 [Isosphaeraceae bacterium]|nr:hypothetical protein [Isosphaeraceae bacterium]
MGERALSRIPFLRRDELMILSMARWMRFVGAVKIGASFFTGFLVLVALIFVGAGMSTGRPDFARVERFVAENRLWFGALGVFALLLSVVGMVLGYVLYEAADDFEQVARTDEADVDYTASGLLRLKTYVKVSVLLGVAALLVAIAAGVVLVVKYRAVS